MSVQPCSLFGMSSTLNDPQFWKSMESMGVANQLPTNAQQTAARARDARLAQARSGRKGKKGRHQSGNPAQLELLPADRAAIRDFRLWLRDQPDPSVKEADFLHPLLLLARKLQINPHTPSGIEDLGEATMKFDDHEATIFSLVTLIDYAEYRLNRDKDDEWNAAKESLLYLSDEIQTRTALSSAIEADDEGDAEERRRAYAETRVVGKVAELLALIRGGRKVTATGDLRRADIAEVAAMLGVTAVGTNTRAPVESEPADGPQPIPALSMRDVVMLSIWWDVLQVQQVIQVSAGRVYPGPTAEHWLDEPLPPLDQAQLLITLFVTSALVTDSLRPGGEDAAFGYTIANLVHALAPDVVPDVSPDAPPLIVAQNMRKLRLLELAGLVEIDPVGTVFVPPKFRGVVARAVVVTLNTLSKMA